MKRDEILQEAERMINGPRAKDYGDAYLNHERIAKMWRVLLVLCWVIPINMDTARYK